MQVRLHTGELTPTITHKAILGKTPIGAIVSIVDDDENHHEIFRKWATHEFQKKGIDTETTPFLINLRNKVGLNLDMGFFLTLHYEGEDPIEYCVSLTDLMVQAIQKNPIVTIMTSNKRLLFVAQMHHMLESIQELCAVHDFNLMLEGIRPK